MTLSDTARDRLDDIRELEPTTNADLAERWGMDSGSDVATYLRNDLDGHVYRDANSKIRVDGGGANVEHDDAGGNRVDPVASQGNSTGEDDPNPLESDAGHDSATPSARDDPNADVDSPPETNTVELTPDEIDEVTETARAEAHAEGYKQGHEGTNGEAGSSRSGCPDCGSPVTYGQEAELFLTADGMIAELDRGDGVCETCDIVVDQDGEVIHGSESAYAEDHSCNQCGTEMMAAEYARYVAGIQYKQTSRLRRGTRRKLRALVNNIDEYEPDRVCLDCFAYSVS